MIKKLLYFLLFISFFSVSNYSEAQGSDFQCTPTNMGFLPFASPCSSSIGFNFGAPFTQTGTTIGASNDSLSGMITSCHSGPPLHDVWYCFNASETHVKIDIQGAGAIPLQDSYVAIYESFTGECVGLIPRQCDLGSGTGIHTMEFGPLTLGVKYYLQIASALPAGDGNFNFSIKSKSICSDCSKNSILNAYPLPVNAAYPPDTTVFFAYSVVGYNESFGNRFHGMVPLLGSGWDATTLTPLDAPDSVDLAGQWKWFNGLTIPGSGTVTGYFYDIGGDNDPRNNVGDHGTFLSSWTFWFSVKTQTVAACNSGLTDLTIRFLNFADGESGSLAATYDCSSDADYVLDAHLECCPKPAGIVGQAASCNSTPNGSIYTYAGFSIFGYEYFLYDENGLLVATHTSAPSSVTPYTFTGLYVGNYYLYFNENKAGACLTGFNVYVPGPVEFDVTQTVFGCGGTGCVNGASVVVTSGSLSSINWSNGETGYLADSLCTGWNYVTVVDTGTVACTIVDSVYIVNKPFANPYFDCNQNAYCTVDSFITVTDFPVAGGGTFSVIFPPVGLSTSDVNPVTGTVDISGVTSSGFVFLKYETSPPCSNSYIDSLFINITPPPPLASMFPDQLLCTGDTANAYLNSSPYDVVWFTDSTLSVFLTLQSPATTFDNFGGVPIMTPNYFNFYLVAIDASNNCKSALLNVSVDIYPIPNVDAGAPLTTCREHGIKLNGSGAANYLWSPASLLNDPNLQSPMATPPATTVFTVVGTEASGCSATDTVTVFVDENGSCDIVTYSGFTPNGDDHNDFWFIGGISVDPKNEVYIFNRWGDKVWETKGYNNKDNRWEGTSYRGNKLVPDGTYFYIIKFKDKDYNGYIELTK